MKTLPAILALHLASCLTATSATPPTACPAHAWPKDVPRGVVVRAQTEPKPAEAGDLAFLAQAARATAIDVSDVHLQCDKTGQAWKCTRIVSSKVKPGKSLLASEMARVQTIADTVGAGLQNIVAIGCEGGRCSALGNVTIPIEKLPVGATVVALISEEKWTPQPQEIKQVSTP